MLIPQELEGRKDAIIDVAEATRLMLLAMMQPASPGTESKKWRTLAETNRFTCIADGSNLQLSVYIT